MNAADAEYTASVIARRLGLPIRAVLVSDNYLTLAPSEIHESDGFSVEVHTTWRTAEARFTPGKFARPLIERMEKAGTESRASFSALAGAAAKNDKLIFRVNGHDLDPEKTSAWPSQWQKLELILKRRGVVFEELTPSAIRRLLTDIVAPIFGMSIALLNIEDVEAEESASEGSAIDVISRQYERKPVNRQICLSIRGSRCYCCNMDFGDVYGSLGNEFIEVHHTTPASEMGPGYVINPVTELVPVCSNCHSVIHLVKPARNVDEVKRIVESIRANNEP